MRIVIALGGNALLRRGQPMTVECQRENVRLAVTQIALIVPGNEIVIAHGNGPQVGLLALQSAACKEVEAYPLDVLGAQTEGMFGHLRGRWRVRHPASKECVPQRTICPSRRA